MATILSILNAEPGANFFQSSIHTFRFKSVDLGLEIDAYEGKKQSWCVVGTGEWKYGFAELRSFVKDRLADKGEVVLPEDVSMFAINAMRNCCRDQALYRTDRIKDLIARTGWSEDQIASSTPAQIAKRMAYRDAKATKEVSA